MQFGIILQVIRDIPLFCLPRHLPFLRMPPWNNCIPLTAITGSCAALRSTSSISASSFGGFVLPGGMFLLIYETRRTLRRLVRHLRSRYESARVGTWSGNFAGNRRYSWVTTRRIFSRGVISILEYTQTRRETKKEHGRGERREEGKGEARDRDREREKEKRDSLSQMSTSRTETRFSTHFT